MQQPEHEEGGPDDATHAGCTAHPECVSPADLAGRPFPLGDWGEPAERLDELYRWVEAGALRTSEWYLADRTWKRRGAIILVSSIGADMCGPLGAPYYVAKAGVNALTKSLAKECAPAGVRVNCIAPGLIETDMGTRMMRHYGDAILSGILDYGPERIAALRTSGAIEG